MAIYNWRVCSASSTSTTFDFLRVVDTSHIEPIMSPIDQFIIKNRELNSMLLDPNNFKIKINELHSRKKISSKGKLALETSLFDNSSISSGLSNLILLGHVSAVESFFREIFRRLILIDIPIQEECYQKELIYGAVLVHEKTSLPDALLELISFSSKQNIESALREFFGVKGVFPTGLEPILKEFSKICQLRHSIIHKFGTIGSNNIKHDITAYRTLINKPIKTNFSTIQEVSQICWNVVHEVNQLLWQNVMMRSIAIFEKRWIRKPSIFWTWNWSKDRRIFMRYYIIFFSTLSSPSVIVMKSSYDDLKNTYLHLT